MSVASPITGEIPNEELPEARPIVPRAEALACVIGTMDLVRPLGRAGIRSAVVARPGSRSRYSRFTAAVVDWIDPWKEPAALVDRLVAFGRSQPTAPVLYYEGDWDLLLVSRYRTRLSESFRFVVPEAELVEDLVDKGRFAVLAERLGLPVPPSRRLSAAGGGPDEIRLRFPLVAKPITRQKATWGRLAGNAKALAVENRRQLDDLWRAIAATGEEVLVQERVPGPETLIESYHVYVDSGGDVAGEFTGRKLRTYPEGFGFSSALEITDSRAVRQLGRAVVGKLGLRGVAKLDFKRGADGALNLLEVNPRFNLWHHPGAEAGVNLPAIVYADLTGVPRPAASAARAGVRWCHVGRDARARGSAGVPLGHWLRWLLSCEAKSAIALDDPMPVIQGTLSRFGRRAS
jgi:D-aspartate ligase